MILLILAGFRVCWDFNNKEINMESLILAQDER